MGSTLTAKFACKFRIIKISLPVPFTKKSLAQNTPSSIDAQASVIPVVRMSAIRLIACPTFRIKGGLLNTFITLQTSAILFFQLMKNIFCSYKQCNDYFMLTFLFKIYAKRKILIATHRTLCSGLCKCNSKYMLVYKKNKMYSKWLLRSYNLFK